jgi:hypothetical protein
MRDNVCLLHSIQRPDLATVYHNARGSAVLYIPANIYFGTLPDTLCVCAQIQFMIAEVLGTVADHKNCSGISTITTSYHG